MKTGMKIAVGLLMVCITASVMAQPAAYRERLSPEKRAQIMAERLKTELSLTDQQVDQIAKLNLCALQARMKRDSIARKVREDHMTELKKILTPEQFQKWSEVQQRRGPERADGRMTPEQMIDRRVGMMKKTLLLTDQQVSQIQKMEQNTLEIQKQRMADRQKERKAQNDEIQKILTPEQYAKWMEMQKNFLNRGPRARHHPGHHVPHSPSSMDSEE